MKKFLPWLVALSLWRFIIGTRHGFGVDEAHYVLYGLNLDWSYFDHPPLIGWIQATFLFIFGRHEWAARLPAVLSGFLSSVLIFRFIAKISKSETQATWSTLALNFSFLPAALWIMFLPDTLIFIFALWLIEIVDHLLSRENKWDWIQLGLCLGLGGLSKYTAVLFIFSILGIAISERAWGRIRPLWFFFATVTALILVIPVFYWNMEHHWISFAYQQSHVMGSRKINFEKFLIFLSTQIVAYSPFLTIASIWGIWAGRKNLTQHMRIALWVAVPTLFFFAYTSLKDEVLPHWTFVGWGIIIPLGMSLGLSQRRHFKWPILISGAVLIFLMLELTFQFIKFPAYQSPYADLVGWSSLHSEIKTMIQKEAPGSFSIAVPNWTLGSRAHYYLSDLAQVFVIDDRFDQFDLWEQNQIKTPNLLVLSWRGFDLNAHDLKRCSKIEPVINKTFSINGSPVNSVQITWCRGFRWQQGL